MRIQTFRDPCRTQERLEFRTARTSLSANEKILSGRAPPGLRLHLRDDHHLKANSRILPLHHFFAKFELKVPQHPTLPGPFAFRPPAPRRAPPLCSLTLPSFLAKQPAITSLLDRHGRRAEWQVLGGGIIPPLHAHDW